MPLRRTRPLLQNVQACNSRMAFGRGKGVGEQREKSVSVSCHLLILRFFKIIYIVILKSIIIDIDIVVIEKTIIVLLEIS